MNREETKEAIKVMQAYVDGEAIQVRSKHTDSDWRDIEPEAEPAWSFGKGYEYRIKPKPREMWVSYDHNGAMYHVVYDPSSFMKGLEYVHMREVTE